VNATPIASSTVTILSLKLAHRSRQGRAFKEWIDRILAGLARELQQHRKPVAAQVRCNTQKKVFIA